MRRADVGLVMTILGIAMGGSAIFTALFRVSWLLGFGFLGVTIFAIGAILLTAESD